MKEYLPIGSVVILENGKAPIMIYGRMQFHVKSNDMFDYIACLYPEGNLSSEYTYLFNHEQIAEILFTGYVNEDEKRFLGVIEELEKEMSGEETMVQESERNAASQPEFLERNASLFVD